MSAPLIELRGFDGAAHRATRRIHLPVLPPHLVMKPEFTGSQEAYDALSEDEQHAVWNGPREECSPSQLSLAGECEIKWAYRYLVGLKERKDSDNYAIIAQNLGHEIHAWLEHYMRGGQINTATEAGARAFPALAHIPHPSLCDEVRIEERGFFDTRRVNAAIEPLHFNFFLDLEFKLRGEPESYLVDYKSTKDFRYAKAEAQLRDDPQGIIYPLSIMHRTGQERIDATWLYLATPHQDPALSMPPSAKPVSLTFELRDVEKRAEMLLVKAVELRNYVREAVAAPFNPVELRPNTEWCRKYYSPKKKSGGCPYRSEIGGPCTHDRPNFGAMLSGLAMLPSLETTETTEDTLETELQKKIRLANERNAQGGAPAPAAQAPAAPAQGPIVFATPGPGQPAVPPVAPVAAAPALQPTPAPHNFAPSPLNPPEAYQAPPPAPPPPPMPGVAPAPQQAPQLPEGLVMGPNGPQLAPGYYWDQAQGRAFPIPQTTPIPQTPVSPAPIPAPPPAAQPTVLQPAAPPPPSTDALPTEAPKRGRGRPKKDQAQEAPAALVTHDGSDAQAFTPSPTGGVVGVAPTSGARRVRIVVDEANGDTYGIAVREEGLANELAEMARAGLKV